MSLFREAFVCIQAFVAHVDIYMLVSIQFISRFVDKYEMLHEFYIVQHLFAFLSSLQD